MQNDPELESAHILYEGLKLYDVNGNGRVVVEIDGLFKARKRCDGSDVYVVLECKSTVQVIFAVCFSASSLSLFCAAGLAGQNQSLLVSVEFDDEPSCVALPTICRSLTIPPP
jgi:hypothetical protein